MIGDLYNAILFQPLFNGLVFIYQYIPNLGIAIIILTLIIKLLLYIPSRSSIRSQKALQDAQPKLKALQEKYKDNKEELGRQIMKFYKENKVNPLSSCLPLLIQLPILIALYRVFIAVSQTDPTTHLLVADQLKHLYEPLQAIFATKPIDPMFLGIVDLSKKGNYILALLAGAAQFWQTKMVMAKKPPQVPGAQDERMTAGINKQMMYFMPIITVFFGIQFAAGLTLYWFVSTLFQVGQQWYVFHKDSAKQGIIKGEVQK
ncbi:MAG: YidC/Oxa1 family membrane protein insertase [Patescibacteria group bacterium]|nr:YidC/Oxa1 family membrane protein insertase [Patescibacteria group bacterium]MDD5715981.1 YidC/Oxa1 family membrane protein insertase [Patescibacteria group bacterium]